jgi:hypothetical protein
VILGSGAGDTVGANIQIQATTYVGNMETSTQPFRDRPMMEEAYQRRLFAFWLALALFLTVWYRWTTAERPYVYAHAWGSSDVATMARSFANNGILALGGVPINNNPPLGLKPSAYTHWPPLLPMILAECFRVFGESEATAHRLMLAMALATAFLLFWITDLSLGRTAACLAAFCWLTLPTVARWGHLVTQESPAILFMLAALLSFLKATVTDGIRWPWALSGGLAMALAAWSSWEAVFLAPGLLIAAWWNRRRSERRLAIIYCVVAVIAVLSIFACYGWKYPDLTLDALQTAKFRMGLANTYSTQLLHRHSAEDSMNLVGIVMNLSRNHWEGIGLLGLGATAWAIFSGLEARKRGKRGAHALVFCGLLAPWLLWLLLMPNDVANHTFELLIAAPMVAMSLAWGGKQALDALARSDQGHVGLRRLVILLVVPFLMLGSFGELLANLELHRGTGWMRWLPLAQMRPELTKPDEFVRFGTELREACAPDAVILSPIESMVAVYYSRRHIIRVIENDGVLEVAVPQAAAAFPGSPLYLALQPKETYISHFPRALSRYPALKSTPDLILLDLEQKRAGQDNGKSKEDVRTENR